MNDEYLTPVSFSRLPRVRYKSGVTKGKLPASELKETTGATVSQTLKKSCQPEGKEKKLKEEKSVTAGSPRLHKRKIWKDRLSTSKLSSLITRSLKTLDQALTSKEKVLTPFWTRQSEEISQRLWLPTKIDCVDSVLNSSKESSPAVMGRSWFSIKKKHPQKKSLLMTSFRSSQFSLPDSTDSEATNSRGKSRSPLKTLKFRLLPSELEKSFLTDSMDQFRWYYNSSLTVLQLDLLRQGRKFQDEFKLSSYTVRDQIVGKYRYMEEQINNLLIQDYVYDEDNTERMKPAWMPGKVNARIQRGAINKLVFSVNSALSNKRNGNISKFQMKYMTKKADTAYLNFEDSSFPASISKIKSRYWYTDKNRKRRQISFSDVFNSTKKKGLEIIYEKSTGKYFLHYPVEVGWFPEEDRRSDNQASYRSSKRNRLISLDPGVRKFMVGYDPRGSCVFFGDGASKELTVLLYRIDKTENKQERDSLWRRVKNMVSELHWKTINYLVKNYDTILLPDFRISSMLRGNKISRMTKRLLCMFSFFSFKLKLKYKCETYGKKLIIVDESYTSKTCGNCGELNDVQGLEVYNCYFCMKEFDRDVNGSRNILIKNVCLR